MMGLLRSMAPEEIARTIEEEHWASDKEMQKFYQAVLVRILEKKHHPAYEEALKRMRKEQRTRAPVSEENRR